MRTQNALYGSDDACDVAVLHGREQRQGENIATDVLGVREVARFPPETPVERKEMDGGVVHAGTDACSMQLPHHLRALDRQTLLGQHDLKHVPVAVHEVSDGELKAEFADARLLEPCEILPRKMAAAAVEGGKMRQLPKTHARGDVGEIELAADEVDLHAVEAAAHDALQTILFRKRGFLGIVHHEAAALDRRHILVGVKADGYEIADRANAPPAPFTAQSLRCVFHDP